MSYKVNAFNDLEDKDARLVSKALENNSIIIMGDAGEFVRDKIQQLLDQNIHEIKLRGSMGMKVNGTMAIMALDDCNFISIGVEYTKNASTENTDTDGDTITITMNVVSMNNMAEPIQPRMKMFYYYCRQAFMKYDLSKCIYLMADYIDQEKGVASVTSAFCILCLNNDLAQRVANDVYADDTHTRLRVISYEDVIQMANQAAEETIRL